MPSLHGAHQPQGRLAALSTPTQHSFCKPPLRNICTMLNKDASGVVVHGSEGRVQ